MEQPKKMVIHNFTQGMDTTTSNELIESNKYRLGMNINVMSTAQGDVGIVTKLKGNVLISKTLPSGRCRTLGYARDEENNKLYEAVWNENGYHTWYQFDGLLNRSIIVLQNITDTGGIDIFGWTEFDLILMTDVINDLLYWSKRGNKASKFNIQKALDKSPTGYGIVTEEFINAYKLAPIVAPAMAYYSDTSVPINRLYGTLIKTAVRHIFDDNEQSNYSDYSNAVVPPKEAFTGQNQIPTDNNAIKITVPTGSSIVRQIEIIMQYTLEGGFSKWVRIAVLDKEELSIGDNTTYTYTFYNSDGDYPVVDQEKVIRPYSFLPRNPLCQAFVQRAMVYANFDAGFENVLTDMYFDDPIYEPLFIEDGIDNKFNEPEILVEVNTANDRYNNGPVFMTPLGSPGPVLLGAVRTRKFKLTIGDDVKQGNIYNLRFQNGYPPDTFVMSYTAKNTDTATSVANKLKQMIINTGRVLSLVDATTPVSANIYTNTNTSGNISFEFILYSSPKLYQYLDQSWSVNPIQYNTLKDTGVSISNMKMGDSEKYGIVYEDDDGRRSLTYTEDDLIVKIDSQNVQGGLKKTTLILNINHRPPVWAKRFQIVRTDSLVYDFTSLIQMVVQKVVDVPLTDQVTGDYLDLLIGSLYTYQKIHPNTTLKYEFKTGDRLRGISKEDGSYYPFFETEILSYQDTVTSVIEQNVVIIGTDLVEVSQTNVDNIGAFIVINGTERKIIDAPDSTHYQIDYPIGEAAASSTFLEFTILDRRGSIRIRKPQITLEDLSLFEIFSPNTSSQDEKQFYHFNKKFDIINWGLSTRQHFGDIQVQTNSQPAKISITEGNIYVRSREMPITNELPAQVQINTIEDPSYSDFYFSRINSNGKPNAEDTGTGVVHFGSRLVYSNNYIEDTKINGLNDFDNLDRRDYNDKYGDVMLIVFTENELLVFKQLKDCAIPVFQTIIKDNADAELLGTSSKLLNEIRYYAHQGGIGNNPESYFSYGNRHYHASVNSGCFVRLSRDGVTPISELFNFDNETLRILRSAYNNQANIYGGFDIPNNVAVFSVPQHPDYTFNSTFNEAQWRLLDAVRAEGTPVEILTQPTHGVATLAAPFANVTNDGTVDSDFFTYRVFVGGQWINRKVCLTYNDIPNRQTAWRQQNDSDFCILNDDGDRTGYKGFTFLEEYYTDDNTTTGNVKANSTMDPDYVAPVFDDVTCVPEITIYYNVEKSAFATKNNCPDGQIGTEEEYVITAGSYSSTVSQMDADTQAQNAADAGAQGYANSVGTCSVPSEIYSLQLYLNDNGDGTGSGIVRLIDSMGTPVTVSVALNFYWGATNTPIAGGDPFPIGGYDTLDAGDTEVEVYSYTIADDAITDLTTGSISPSSADGKLIQPY